MEEGFFDDDVGIEIQSDVIMNTDEPTGNSWFFEPLYKKSARKSKEGHATSVWQIGFDGKKLVTIYGIIGGKLQMTTRAVVVNKSGRSLKEQGILESRHKHSTKLDDGYRSVMSDLVSAPKGVMLANDYFKVLKKTRGYTMEFPVYIQCKLDGVRAMCFVGHNEINLESEDLELKEISFTSRDHKHYHYLDHLRREALELFRYLPAGSILDGEIYMHDYAPKGRFNTIVSSLKNIGKRHKLNEQLSYCVYDIILPYPSVTEDRMELLQNTIESWMVEKGYHSGKFKRDIWSHGDTFIKEPKITLVYGEDMESHEAILKAQSEYVGMGFEGIMIRHLSSEAEAGSTRFVKALYRESRSDNLLKCKQMKEAEAEVIDVISAKGREEGLALLTLRTPTGIEFNLRPMGSESQRRDWLQRRDELIGKLYTYKYFENTEAGNVRFPTGATAIEAKAFRDYE